MPMVVGCSMDGSPHWLASTTPQCGTSRCRKREPSTPSMAENGLALAQDLVGLAKLPVLPLQGLHLLGHLAGNACALTAVNLGPLDPVVQPVRRAADLRGNRRDRLPARAVLALVVENHPHGALAHFRGKLVRGLAHDAPSHSGVGASGKLGAVQNSVFPSGAGALNHTAPKPVISDTHVGRHSRWRQTKRGLSAPFPLQLLVTCWGAARQFQNPSSTSGRFSRSSSLNRVT